MEQQTSKHVIIYILLFIIGAGAGVLAAPYVNPGNSYNAGFDTAKSLVQKSSIGAMLQDHGAVTVLAGQVIAINGTSFTLRVQSADPFYDQSLSERTVTTDSSTKVVANKPKDQKTLQAEMDAFAKASQSNKSNIAPPPSMFTSEPSSMASLAVGDSVVVTSAQDISKLKDFAASQIQINAAR